jgi:hypothetical protein
MNDDGTLDKKYLIKQYYKIASYKGISVKFTKFEVLNAFEKRHGEDSIITLSEGGANDEKGKDYMMKKGNDGRVVKQLVVYDDEGQIYDIEKGINGERYSEAFYKKMFPKIKYVSGKTKPPPLYDMCCVIGLADCLLVCNISQKIRDGDIDEHVFNSLRLSASAYGGVSDDDSYKIPIEWFTTVKLPI